MSHETGTHPRMVSRDFHEAALRREAALVEAARNFLSTYETRQEDRYAITRAHTALSEALAAYAHKERR